MAPKKVFILVGHPNKETLSGHIADTYEVAAKSAGHEVRRMNIGDLSFDPILHMGYKAIQALEPDLKTVQENVKWADTFVLIFPTWWGDMPALLKGLFDRAWLPGFAYNMNKNGLGWIKRLKGKQARIITTSATNHLILKFFFHVSYTHLRWLTLWFSGFSPVRMTRIGDVEKITPNRVARFDKRVSALGRKAK
ncbi:MAG TPA: NAD(P)H-dependent oxidoreductase [Candidatus Paceibacterota bacterium]